MDDLWRIYEEEKQKLKRQDLSQEEYERRLGEICKRLGL